MVYLCQFTTQLEEKLHKLLNSSIHISDKIRIILLLFCFPKWAVGT